MFPMLRDNNYVHLGTLSSFSMNLLGTLPSHSTLGALVTSADVNAIPVREYLKFLKYTLWNQSVELFFSQVSNGALHT